MKKFFLITAMALVVLPSFSQITEGEPRATTLPTGNRLEKGIWGVFIGGAATWDKQDKDFDEQEFHVTPLVNVKYMLTDKIETRLGFEFGKTRDSFSGTIEGQSSSKESEEKTVDSERSRVNSHFFFNPGAAYHFSKNNLLDVYAGAEIPFGWERATNKYIVDDKERGSTYSPKFNIGFGAFIGLQAFIGRLPLSIGLEYGFQSLYAAGKDKTKTVSYVDGEEQVTYSFHNENLSGQDFKSLTARHGEIRSQVRLTLSYYFK